MSALTFDPWAALKMQGEGWGLADPANPSGIRGRRLAALAALAGGHPSRLTLIAGSLAADRGLPSAAERSGRPRNGLGGDATPVPQTVLVWWEFELSELMAICAGHAAADQATYGEACRRLEQVAHDQMAAGVLMGFWRGMALSSGHPP